MSYASSPVAVTINLEAGIFSGGHAEGDTLFATLDAPRLRGSAFNDILIGRSTDYDPFVAANAGVPEDDIIEGGDGSDFLSGLAGNDYLVPGLGANVLDGGPGFDTASYRDKKFIGINLNLAGGKGDPTKFTISDTFTSIESFQGSDFDDYIAGYDAPARPRNRLYRGTALWRLWQ